MMERLPMYIFRPSWHLLDGVHHKTIYRRPGFDCVVKLLQMALYKRDCDFNDCELPSGQYIIN